MKILKFTFILIGCTLIAFSCSKDPIDPVIPADDNKISTTAATNKCDYSPYSPGTTFTFELATKNTFDEKWTYVENRGNMTGYQDLNGKKYSIGKGFFPQDSSVKQDDGLIRCDGVGMFILAKGLDNGKDFELPVLQYPLTKSKTWKSAPITTTQQGYTTTNQYSYKVLNTGLTKTIKKNTFKDVIEIDESLIVTSTVLPQPFVFTYKRFYDKQVGLIQTIFYNTDFFTGKPDTSLMSSIVSYSIK
jgi:hypothetical protein